MNKSKLHSVLAAGALGDAVGYAVEFDSWARIQQDWGPQGLARWPLHPKTGTMAASDDTQMTLFAMEAIGSVLTLRGPLATESELLVASRSAFLRWLQTQGGNGPLGSAGLLGRAEMFHRAAPGNTCISALTQIARGSAVANQSKGCGAAMRAAPYAALAKDFGLDFVWRAASAQGDLTHRHIDGHISGAALAFIIGSEPKDMGELASRSLEAASRAELAGAVGTAHKLRQAVDLSSCPMDPQTLCNVIGEGWVGDEAVGVALWCALRSSSASEAIFMAANHRGDSDSTASMAGQLAAGIHGLAPRELAGFSSVDLSFAMEEQCARLSLALSFPAVPAGSGATSGAPHS